ncbi:hypothetical protein CAS74_004367 [Pichia kudriavzevii]|uniref:Uncharacterized protein n=2 Tax=Pichia kudriavzevii TaxID=4909 RepID=A0A1Z8JJD7_PICKU|nr:hypothetical protein CAS74_004367 [Pichia kudriavzevii]
MTNKYLKWAWERVTGSENGRLRMTNLLHLFDVLDELVGFKLLNDVYREFLVDLIMECPASEIDILEFQQLIEKMFECTFDDVLNGKLSNKETENEEFTKTMNVESIKFNSFMREGTDYDREENLRQRIQEMERMIERVQRSSSKDYRTMDKMKDVLIDYYRRLDRFKKSHAGGPGSELTERLKRGIEKQDMLINELREKVGDNRPTTVMGKIYHVVSQFFSKIWNLLRYPVYVMLAIMVINFVYAVVHDESDVDDNDMYW